MAFNLSRRRLLNWLAITPLGVVTFPDAVRADQASAGPDPRRESVTNAALVITADGWVLRADEVPPGRGDTVRPLRARG